MELKFRKIADELRDGILNGEYPPGSRLPGEAELMPIYRVARETARKALGVLHGEGLTVARRGAGTFVKDLHPIRRRSVQRLARSQWGNGESVWKADFDGDFTLIVDRIRITEMPAPEAVAEELQLAPDSAVCVRTRRFLLDGRAVLLSRSYLPAQLVKGSAITQEDTGPGGTYARLAELGSAPVWFVERVRCRMPLQKEREGLELGAGTPVIEVVRTAFAEVDRPVEMNVMVMDSTAYELEYGFSA